MKQIVLKTTLCAAVALGMVGCNDNDDNSATSQPKVYKKTGLVISHINDHHSFIDKAGRQSFEVNGKKYYAERGGFSRVTQFIKDAEKAHAGENFLKLHAGDAITGTRYFSFYKGQADADMMKTVCFDAFALGNHEFDEGDAGLVKFLDWLNAGSCKVPALAANVVPKIGTPLAKKSVTDYIQPYTIKTTKEGVKVGIIGIDIAGKTKNSSRPLETTQFLKEVETAQKYIDMLKGKGIAHIILLTHQGYKQDQAMAAKLTDVDVIIGGDSHTLLGDFSRFGIKTSGKYPTITKNKNGETVCIGQAWEYAKAVGMMKVSFNEKGQVASCTGSANMMLSKTITQKVKVDGKSKYQPVDAATNQNVLNALAEDFKQGVVSGTDYLVPTTREASAEAVLATYKKELDAKGKEVIGATNDALCLIRIPGGKDRSTGVAGCENITTLASGSDAAQVVAASFLDASLLADAAIQNAGGVRIAVPKGSITNDTAFRLLPFGNTLVELQMTGQQIIAVLEDAVANHLDNDGSSGSHPYAEGLRWDLDMSKAQGSRFSNVEIKDRKAGTWSAVSANKTYTIVTNDYIAEGRDGYATFGSIFKAGKVVDTKLLYADSFINYVKKVKTVQRPARADYSHKSVITKAGTKLQ